MRPPEGAPRERILLMGGYGVGKSYAALQVAEAIPDIHMHYLDTDFAMPHMLYNSKLTNVTVYPVESWEDFEEAKDKAHAAMTPDDWIVVDFLSHAWDLVQEFYAEKIFGKDMATIYLDFRDKAKKGNPLDGYKDWSVINKLYRRWATSLIKDTPGHILAITGADQVTSMDADEIKTLFKDFGHRPRGQKHTGHLFRSILMLNRDDEGNHYLTTARESSGPTAPPRTYLDATEYTNFPMTYLVKVAKWLP